MTVFDGRTVRAVDVAPGQSGFVRRTALSPHARDQLDLYTGFGSKRVVHGRRGP